MRDPLKGWTRKDAALTDPFSIEQPAVDRTGPGLEFGQVVQAALHSEVVGVVDDGLDAQRTAVFEVLLDPGMLVERVHGDLDTAGDDLGLEHLRGHRSAAGSHPPPGEPYLEQLNAELGETVHLGLLDGSTVRFIDAVESPRAVRVTSRLGRSMPAHATSTGKAMLAQLSTGELHALYPHEELEALTERSSRSRSRSELEAQLATVRKRGYATSTEESESGVSSVAVAFPFRGTPARIAFNVAVATSRMSAADQRAIGATLGTTVLAAAELLHG